LSRSLPPSPRRLRESRRRGEIPVSRALVGLGATVLGLAALGALLPGVAREEAGALRRALLAAVVETDAAPLDLALSALARVGRLTVAPAAAACAGALLAGLAQTGGLFTTEALRLRWDRLAPSTGLRRAFSPAALGRAVFTLSIGAAAIVLTGLFLAAQAPALARIPRLLPGGAWTAASAIVGSAAGPLLALLSVAGLGDFLLLRHRHLRNLRMNRSELERDLREDEGDPRLRSERRRLHASLGGSGARAACLVVNPSHLAVALAHRRGGEDPPVVLAKASGGRAVALRREARRLGVPVVHDRPLARALFRLADVGDAIPEELYEATAAVLAHVHALAPGRRA
jgi:type III secretion protein U